MRTRPAPVAVTRGETVSKLQSIFPALILWALFAFTTWAGYYLVMEIWLAPYPDTPTQPVW